MKIKILPITILTCTLFLGGKTLHLVEMSHAETAVDTAKPQDKLVDTGEKTNKPDTEDKVTKDEVAKEDKVDIIDDNKPPSTAQAEPDKSSDPKADGKLDATKDQTASADKPEESKDDTKNAKDSKDTKGQEAKSKLPTNVSYKRPEENIPQFTDSEKQVLQKLADRRAELDAYAKDLDLRASLIDASSKKVDAKLEELKKLKADTETILATYNEHEETKIRSLVKIYENMKPSAAAGIFEQMDMDTLLEIIDKMAEKKASAVLAVMDPKKAKEITQKLADEKTLKKQTTMTTAPKAATAATPAAPAPQAAAAQPAASVTPQPQPQTPSTAEGEKNSATKAPTADKPKA